MNQTQWQFWIDRGGTFTDIVARKPEGSFVVHKLLSENPAVYDDAVLHGIREVLGLTASQPLPIEDIDVIKMGTTVATNALLERKGDPTVFVTTQGFADVLRIGYQNRPDIFALQIVLPDMLYEQVVEIEERYGADGEELIPVNLKRARQQLQAVYDQGIRGCAIAFMHGYRYPDHERQVAALAHQIGFTQISVSHQVSSLIKLVSRSDTTVVDAYLSPILRRYVDRLSQQLRQTRLLFMQSHGGLVDAQYFQGKDSILSGPAGGVVGMVQTTLKAGFQQIIGFDMGGTSTDVCHYNGAYERILHTEIAGVRLSTPMMAIHTVAAGGGSILTFDGSRFRVGPQSAGADPGPACYRQGGPLTITDCNVMVGKIQPEFFPQIFGPQQSLPIDREIVHQKFTVLGHQVQTALGQHQPPEQIAQGFLAIAIENMANAIKKISLQKGHDVSTYTLCCFGSAGGQHACAIADILGIRRIFIHPFAGVLSAFGMGLADVQISRQQTVEIPLTAANIHQLTPVLAHLTTQVRTELQKQQITNIQTLDQVYVQYVGTDTSLSIAVGTLTAMQAEFERLHLQRYGFIDTERLLMITTASVEGSSQTQLFQDTHIQPHRQTPPEPKNTIDLFTQNQWWPTPVYDRETLQPGDQLDGPALILEPTGTNVIEPGWHAHINDTLHLILGRSDGIPTRVISTTQLSKQPDPVLLEIFNNVLMAIAEQMGVTLQNTSYSVNIKERLDFSCGIFDAQGQLIANAPHIPVHLGSMGDSVAAVITTFGESMEPGDAYLLNDPYQGGTHLPDITLITPVFLTETAHTAPQFFVVSRGHHADIGGITPGSMPPQSTTIMEEGILIPPFLLVRQGQLREQELLQLFTDSPYPARNPQQNLADLQAQLAANQSGRQALQEMVDHYSWPTVDAYMHHLQDHGEECVRQAITKLEDSFFCYDMDDGLQIQVTITIDPHQRHACIDFTGTSDQQPTNFNAPIAVTKAAVLYVFRTLVADDIPLNGGCLRPLDIRVPTGSLLNPRYPAAVVAGNVETSQAVTNALYGALGLMAAAQGTMNNVTFGTDRYQYYETLCGGSGAGSTFAGVDAIQTHMTNSRLTDPEVLESRFPVRLEEFSIRPASGGGGQQPGGNGVIRRLRFLEPMTAAILSGHRQVQPCGLQGGQSGAVGLNQIQHADAPIQRLPGQAILNVVAGDQIIIQTPGGGGYGSLS